MKNIFTYIKSNGLITITLLTLYLLNPFNYDYVIGFILVPVIFIHRNFIKQNIDFDFVLLLLFSVIYASFYSLHAEVSQGKQFIAIYAITPPTFYLIGKYLLAKNSPPNTVFYILFSIGTIFSISAMISVFTNFQEGGFAQMERTIPMFWNNNPVSATIMGAYLTFNMCIPAIMISDQGRKGIIFYILSSILFTISLICVLRLGSRTQLGIFFITSIVSLFYIIPKQSLKKNTILIVLLTGVIIYILNTVSFDLNQDWLTTFSDRMGKRGSDIASGGGRTERWLKSFEYLFKKPLGWDAREFGYSHNLWLDVLRVAGVIPFFLLVIYSIRSFIQIKKTLFLNRDNISLNAQILIYTLAFFMLFMVEPIFEGIFSFFVVFCLYKGIINKHYTNLSHA